MKELAEGVFQLRLSPPNAINVYLVGDVLVDAGVRWNGGRILSELNGHTVSAHALTHAHPDHQGASHRVCSELGIPYLVGIDDVEAAEDPVAGAQQVLPVAGPRWLTGALLGPVAGPGHPVERGLAEGDELAGFEVLHTPGHTAGHLAFWRESDRTLIAGDAIWNIDFLPRAPGLTLPASLVNFDHQLARESARRLAALEPELVCFGHGSPLRDPAALAEFAAGIPPA